MKYISVLRGINVGGHKKILMVDLKNLYKKLGYTQILSYIQSGNVVFDSDNGDRNFIVSAIETAISKQYGFDVTVIIRTHAEIKHAIKNMPYGDIDLVADGAKYFLTLLSENPSKENSQLLMGYVKPPEQMTIEGNHIYTHYPNGAGRSKLTNALMENKLKVKATSRNWKSLVKLIELSSD